MLLGKGLIDDINDSVSTAGKKFEINFTKTKTQFPMSLLYDSDEIFYM